MKLVDRLLGARRCLVCENRISSGYYTDWSGACVCMSHQGVKSCISCGRFCKDFVNYNFDNGLGLCEFCKSDLINKEIVGNVVNYIRRGYEKAGFGKIDNWRLFVTDPKTMLQTSGSPYVKGYARQLGGDYQVCVLKHLSRVSFADVLAHELLHIWQYNHHYSPEDWLCEGFCNMGSYYVLQHIGTEEAKAHMERMMSNPNPIYGEGFRRVKVVYDKDGWDGVRKLMKR